MPGDQVVWLLVLIAVALLLVWCAWRARIDVDQDEVRIVNLWRVHRLATADVEEARPSPFGVEFLDRRGKKPVAIAVQATAVFRGRRPRWVDVAEVVTGTAPEWDAEYDEEA